MKKIKAIVKRPDEKYGHVANISNTLRNFQRIVDGPIETIPLIDGSILIVNEEGKLRKLQKNFTIGLPPFIDVIVGTAIVVGTNGENLCDCSISFDSWKFMLDRWRF